MISINSSVLNLKLQNLLLKNVSAMNTSLQRLVTGLRINKASDDPAGFYISSKMNTQIRGLESANINIQEALSMLGTADEKIGQINTLMGKIRDLVQKSTDAYLSDKERQDIQKQVNTLFGEVQKLKEDASYGNHKLFSSSTTLDKNATYYNDKQQTGSWVSGKYNVVTQAAGYTLNRLDTGTANLPDLATTVDLAAYGYGGYVDETVPAAGDGGVADGEAAMPAAGEEVLIDEGSSPAAYDPAVGEPAAYDPWVDDGMAIPSADDEGIAIGDEGFAVADDGAAVAAYDPMMDEVAAYDTEGDAIAAYDTGIATCAAGGGVAAYSGEETQGEGTTTQYVTGPDTPLDGLTEEEIAALEAAAAQGGNAGIATAAEEPIIDWSNYTDLGTSSSSITVAAGSGQVVKINDLLYYVENTSTYSSDTLYYATNTSTNTVTFETSGTAGVLVITAADGQADNIVLNIGNGSLYTGDGNDSITNLSSYVIDAGEGNDSVDNSGYGTTIGLGADEDTITNSGQSVVIIKGEANSTDSVSTTQINTVIVDEMLTMDFTYGQTQSVSIDNKTYTVTNKTSADTLKYGINSQTGQVAFLGSDFNITAADGQTDNIHFGVTWGTLNTGDGNDSVTNSGYYSTIALGADNDVITNTSSAVIDAGDGNDNVNNSAQNSTIGLGAGDDTITNTESSVKIDAGEGNDSVNNSGRYSTIGLGAGDDTITNTSYDVKIDAGADNDVITNTGKAVIDAGDGNDSVDNSGYGTTTGLGAGDDTVTNSVSGVVIVKGEANSTDSVSTTKDDTVIVDEMFTMDFTSGQTQTVSIDNKTYTVTNNKTSANTLSYGFNSQTGQIAFLGSSFGVTAADGQTDNIKFMISYGILNTGDENDSVNNSAQYSTIGLGAGEDTITNSGQYVVISKGEANSTDSVSTTRTDTLIVDEMFTMDFTSGQTQTVSIDNKTYTVTNNKTSANTLSYGFNSQTGQIAFLGSSFGVTAADGQADNIKFNIWYGILNTGDGNDSVNNSAQYSTIGLGAGDDTITNTGYSAVIDAGEGNDSVNNSGGYSTIGLGAGNDTATNSDTRVTINGGDGTDVVNKTYAYTSTNTNVEKVIDWYSGVTNLGTSGTYEFAAGAGKVVQINGMKYYIENTDTTNAQTLTYSTDENGQITLQTDSTYSIEITAHSDQTDNVVLDGRFKFDAGNMDDTVIIGAGASVFEASLGAGNDVLYNYGFLYNVYGEAGDDSIVNEGYVHYDIQGGDGADTITNAVNASVGDNIFGEAGDDSIVNEGVVSDGVYGQDSWSTDTSANDVLKLGASSSIGGATANDETSVNAVVSAGKITGIENFEYPAERQTSGSVDLTGTSYNNQALIEVELSDGRIYKYDVYGYYNSTDTLNWSIDENDQITFQTDSTDDIRITAHENQNDNILVDGQRICLDTGNYDDTITIQNAYSINSGAGDDILYNYGVISTTIGLYAGNDSLVNEGIVWGIYGGDGADTITNAANASVGNCIYGDAGDDSIVNEGKICGIGGGDGADIIINAQGAYVSSIGGGAGNDTITNAANASVGSVYCDAGDDSIVNEGVVSGIIHGGDPYSDDSANDVLKLGASSSIGGAAVNNETSVNAAVLDYKIIGIENFEYPAERQTSGSVDLAGTSESSQSLIQIELSDGRIYKYNAYYSSGSDANKTLNWSIDENDQITFQTDSMNDIYIIAHSDQTDNVSLDGEGICFDTGNMDDTVIIGAGASVLKASLGAGNDVLYNYGDLYNVDGGDGADTITNAANASVGYILGDAGNDSIVNEGYVYIIKGGDGADTITNAANASVGYGISGDTGDDSITNEGNVRYNIDGGDDADVIINAQDAYVSSIAGGAGNDTITNYGEVGGDDGISAGAGNDILYNYGVISSTIGLYAGDDIVWNYGEARGFYGGDGNDSIVNNGDVYCIYGGTDNDTITNAANASVGNVYGDAGNDSIVNNGFISEVFGGAGNDTVVNEEGAWTSTGIYGDAGDDSIVNNGRGPLYVMGGDYMSNDTSANDVLKLGASSSIGGSLVNDAASLESAMNNNAITGIEAVYDSTDTQIYPVQAPTDEDGNVIDEEGNIIGGPDSEGGASEEGGSGTETITIGAGKTVTVKIDGKYYDVKNNETGESTTLTYTLSSGQITFESSDDLTITAHESQEDNVLINGANITFDANDLDDTIVVEAYGYASYLFGGSGNDSIVNEGEVGNISGGDNNDTIINTTNASVGWVINGGAGDDSIVNEGYVDDNINGGAGDDSIVNEGRVNSISSGDGNDTITNAANASVGGIYGDAGDDSIVNEGIVSGAIGGEDGADTITNATNASVGDSISGDAGDDSIVNEGEASGLVGGAHADIIINAQDAYVSSIAGGAGNDTITNYGEVGDDGIRADAGNDSIVNEGKVQSDIYGEDGADTITNAANASVGAVYGGAGNDSIVNEGKVEWVISGDDGADTITNAANASVGYHIWGNVGNDSIVNEGIVSGVISGGAHLADGGDYLFVGANSSVGGFGANGVNDALTANKIQGIENIEVEGGQKTITIGAGETQTIEIEMPDGSIYKYDVTKLDTGASTTLTYVQNGGQITFESKIGLLEIRAHDNQNDNILVDGQDIILVTGDYDDTITIKNAASVDAEAGNDSIVNEGYVIDIAGGDGADTITNTNAFVRDAIYGDAGDDSIVNEGEVNEFIYGGDGADTIINAANASVGDGVSGDEGDDSIVNEGRVNDYIYGDDGADTITNAANAYVGYVYGDAGDDSIVNEGIVRWYIYGRDGADTIINAANASVGYHIYGNAGNDSIVNEGDVERSIYGGDGADIIINAQDAYVSSIAGGADNDTITNYGEIGSNGVSGDEGDDSIVNEGYVEYNIYGGDGADTITNAANASVGNGIYGEAGDDSIVNEGKVQWNISGDDGTDTITNAANASVGYIYGETGDDSIVNEGYVEYNIYGGDDADVIINAQDAYVSSIGGGSGNDTITNYGEVGSDGISGDAGDDSIVNEGIVSGVIYGGAHLADGGDYLFVGANSSVGGYGANGVDDALNADKIRGIENIEVEGGQKTITIGAGETQTIEIEMPDGSIYKYDVKNRDTGASTTLTYGIVDGQIEFNSETGKLNITAHNNQNDNILVDGVHINLNTGDFDDMITILNAKSINSGAGNDSILVNGNNTENITGSDGNDTITISANASVGSYINSGAGDDSIVNSGVINQYIVGADGNDSIIISANASVGSYINGNAGDDVIENNGVVNGYLQGEAGNDYIMVSSNAVLEKHIVGDAGDDTIIVEGTANGIYNTVSGGNGNDVINISGSIANQFTSGAGNDSVNISGSVGGSLWLNEGDDTIVISGYVKGEVQGNAGNDSITIEEGGYGYLIYGESYANTTDVGNDTIIVSGSTGNYIVGNEGDDYIHITETGKVGASVNGSNGNDTIIMDGFSLKAVSGGIGDDSISVAGTVTTQVSGNEGNDTITIEEGANILDYVSGAAGDDSISVAGTVTTQVNGNDGNDTITIEEGANILDYVSGVAGNDSIIVSGSVANGVFGSDGDDTVILNGTNLKAWGGNQNTDTSTSDIVYVNGSDNTVTGFELVYGTDSTAIIKKNQTITIDIDGMRYDVKNTGTTDATLNFVKDENGQILFESETGNLTITAHENQKDNILVDGQHISLNTGNYDDTITIQNARSINAGAGDDSIVNEGKVEWSISGGDGADIIINDMNSTLGYVYGDAGNDSIVNEGYVQSDIYGGDGADTITNAANASVGFIFGDEGDDSIVNKSSVLHISAGAGNDFVKNDGIIDSVWELTISSTIGVSLDEGDDTLVNNGTIDFILGGDGDDSVENNGKILDTYYGGDNVTDTSDNDSLHIGSNSSYGLTSGVENITSDNPSNTINIATGETVTVDINGKKYDITNWDGVVGTLTYTTTDEKITFESGNSLTISAHSGQADNIIVKGAGITLDTGDLGDYVEIQEAYQIITGDADDTVKNTGYVGMGIYTGIGDDRIFDDGGLAEIYGQEGQDYIVVNGSDSTVFGGDGNDKIFLNGDNIVSDGGAGDDYTYITGNYNIASGGTDGYDKVANKGNNSTYSGMNELVDKEQSFGVQTNYKFTQNSVFDVKIDAAFQDINIDLSTSENAFITLDQIDKMIEELTLSRSNLAFQSQLLNTNLEQNLTKIANLKDSRSSLIDADTAYEYNNLIAKASLIEQIQLMQSQLQATQANTLLTLIQSIAG